MERSNLMAMQKLKGKAILSEFLTDSSVEFHMGKVSRTDLYSGPFAMGSEFFGSFRLVISDQFHKPLHISKESFVSPPQWKEAVRLKGKFSPGDFFHVEVIEFGNETTGDAAGCSKGIHVHARTKVPLPKKTWAAVRDHYDLISFEEGELKIVGSILVQLQWDKR